MSIDAMKQALKALEFHAAYDGCAECSKISNALRAAIEAAERQVPVAEVVGGLRWIESVPWSKRPTSGYLYTTPQPTQKVEPVAKVKKCHMDDRDWFDIDPLMPHDNFTNGQLLYTHPQPAIPDGWQLVPTKDTDAAKEIVHRAFNEAMSIQAGELGPITLRQKNAIHAIVWAVIEAMLAAAPKPGEKK